MSGSTFVVSTPGATPIGSPMFSSRRPSCQPTVLASVRGGDEFVSPNQRTPRQFAADVASCSVASNGPGTPLEPGYPAVALFQPLSNSSLSGPSCGTVHGHQIVLRRATSMRSAACPHSPKANAVVDMSAAGVAGGATNGTSARSVLSMRSARSAKTAASSTMTGTAPSASGRSIRPSISQLPHRVIRRGTAVEPFDASTVDMGMHRSLSDDLQLTNVAGRNVAAGTRDVVGGGDLVSPMSSSSSAPGHSPKAAPRPGPGTVILSDSDSTTTRQLAQFVKGARSRPGPFEAATFVLAAVAIVAAFVFYALAYIPGDREGVIDSRGASGGPPSTALAHSSLAFAVVSGVAGALAMKSRKAKARVSRRQVAEAAGVVEHRNQVSAAAAASTLSKHALSMLEASTNGERPLAVPPRFVPSSAPLTFRAVGGEGEVLTDLQLPRALTQLPDDMALDGTMRSVVSQDSSTAAAPR